MPKETKLFRNPIQAGFSPDPSICRAGNDYYLVNSTFAYFPGLPVYHSTDLIRWKQIGNVIDRPGQIDFDGHGISQGLFAPTIRWHQGKFYVLCTLINTGGNFIVTAENPAGPWSDPVWLCGAEGIDPSIFFDNDGKVWYAGNRPAPEGQAYPGNYEIWIQEMNLSLLAEGKNPLTGESLGIWRGALRDCIWPEGPHIYKIGGWYYLLHAEGGTALDHAVCVARAENIRGTWKGKPGNPLLTHRHLGKSAETINVGHADLFDDPQGNWWMITLGSRPFGGVCPLGRETFLVPIRWEDDWPCVATESGLVEKEFSVPGLRMADNENDPTLPAELPGETACDHFCDAAHNATNNAVGLPLHWLTLRMPSNAQDAAFTVSGQPNGLRLFTRAATLRGTDHPAFAGRRLRHRDWVFSAAIEFLPKTETEAAGIVLLQNENWQYRFEICLVQGRAALRLVRAAGADDETLAVQNCPATPLVLAASSDNLKLSFFFGKDQYSQQPFADGIDGRILSTEHAGGFVGTLAGVFASGNGTDTNNHADVPWAEYRGV